jgi:hypothetical protein
MLSVSVEDDKTAADLSDWLRTEAPLRDRDARGCGYLTLTTGPDTRWGGWKQPECEVWAGALNHADLDALVARVRQTPWQVPLAVQLFVQDQEQAFFRLWMFRDGGFRQLVPDRPAEEDPDFFPPDL